MKIKYTANIYDAGTVDEAAPLLLIQSDFDIDVDLDWENGEPSISVSAVYLDGQNLFAGSDPFAKAIAARVMDIAERDDDLLGQVMAASGTYWCGRGPNDPDGKYRRVA